MLAANGKITMRQLQILIILSAMGTGIIVLPRRVAEYAGQDGWVIVVGLVVLSMLVGLLISAAVQALAQVKPGAGFVEVCCTLLTRPVAYFIGVALWLKLVLSAGLELRVFMDITEIVMLPRTPIAAVSILMLLVCAYTAAKGMETRARVAEVLLGVMALPFIFIIALAFFDTNFTNLQPVLVTEPQRLISGTLRLGFIFTGLECLLLVSPFIKKEKRMGRRVATALGFAGAIILLITVLTIAKFGHGVTNQPWPVLRMMDMINMPGSFIERQEALMFSFWIITAFAVCNTMLFFGGLLVKDIFKPKARHMGVIVTMVAVFAVSIFPWGDNIYKVLDGMYLTAGIFFMVILPLILLTVAKLKVRKLMTVTAMTISVVILFTSCWDRVEIEERAFVVAIGIDNEDGKYAISLSVPLLEKDNDDDHDSDKPPHIKTATGATITEAMKNLDAKTDKTLFYGQAKLLVFGENLLENEAMLQRAIVALKSHNEIDLRINILAAEESAKDILLVKPPGETLPGLFVADMYRNKNKLGGESFALDLERLASSYANGAVIPMIKKDDNEGAPLRPNGATVINGSKIGTLSHDELRGYLWCKNHGNTSAIVIVEDIAVKVEHHKAKVGFFVSHGDLHAVVDVNITAQVEEGQRLLPGTLEEFIAKEMNAVVQKLQQEYVIDAFDWLEKLRQKEYALYKVYKDDWENVVATMKVVPRVYVKWG